MPTVLVTGANGMLGRTLANSGPIALSHAQLDITDAAAVERVIADRRPGVVINCAAMTAVDRCESERDLAHRINALGPEHLAKACDRIGAKLVQISTDYVFSGTLDRPYSEQDIAEPRTVYGESKLAGERAVQNHCRDHLIVRTAWLYGSGGPSFYHTMIALAKKPDADLKVVDDQIGNPTSTTVVAAALAILLDARKTGVVHVSCEGEATWFEFARTIFALRGLTPKLRRCSTADFPRPAPRPANSRLAKNAWRAQGFPPLPEWRDALADYVKEFGDG